MLLFQGQRTCEGGNQAWLSAWARLCRADPGTLQIVPAAVLGQISPWLQQPEGDSLGTIPFRWSRRLREQSPQTSSLCAVSRGRKGCGCGFIPRAAPRRSVSSVFGAVFWCCQHRSVRDPSAAWGFGERKRNRNIILKRNLYLISGQAFERGLMRWDKGWWF